MFKRVLIANRGEIAVRVIRACQELGIETVAVYSTADADALHVQLADRAVCVGPPRAAESYLNVPALLTAGVESGCDAVHPGYGFLSEDAAFADLCVKSGLTFIGPPAARSLMRGSGVPVVPGSDGPVADSDAALRLAEEIGYPVLLKASAGGGGRGMRRVDRPEELAERYHAQLEYYDQALCMLTGKKVKERLIYSFRFGKVIRL